MGTERERKNERKEKRKKMEKKEKKKTKGREKPRDSRRRRRRRYFFQTKFSFIFPFGRRTFVNYEARTSSLTFRVKQVFLFPMLYLFRHRSHCWDRSLSLLPSFERSWFFYC